MKKNFYKDILETIREPLCVVDSSETILYRNPAFDQHFQIDERTDFHAFSQLPEKYTSISLIRECIRDKKSETRVLQEGTDTPLEVSVTRLAEDPDDADCYIEQILAFPAKASDRPQTSQSSLSFDELVISDRAMADINQTISRIAYFDSTILIQGESGTGKTALARHIHKNSNRAQKPFVTINCGSIPESLIESELFGYASGAFTSASKKGKPGQVELADGGTLFLDEIGLLPYNLQSKFLQLIQEKTYTPVGALKSKTVNVRIIAATNENLKEFIKAKKFREDLYYRLRVIELFIPPLRDRADAIEPLVNFFISKYNDKFDTAKTITPTAVSMLKSYSWPGNIRELQYLIEKIIITSGRDIITTDDIPPLHDVEQKQEIPSDIPQEDDTLDFEAAVSEFESKILAKYYAHYKSSYKVADALGITQTKASRLLRKYQISK